MPHRQRPEVELVIAMSADGKIADAQRTPRRIASPRDRAVWDQAMVRSDAVLYGAGTLRSVGRSMQTLPIQKGELHPEDVRPNIIASVSGDLDPDLRFFQEPYPRWLVTARTPELAVARLFERVIVSPTKDSTSVDWPTALQEVFKAGIRRLCCGGGGGLAASLFRAGLIDEYLLTVSPLVVGGRSAPTPVDGDDLPLGEMPTLQLIAHEVVQGEIFARYRVNDSR